MKSFQSEKRSVASFQSEKRSVASFQSEKLSVASFQSEKRSVARFQSWMQRGVTSLQGREVGRKLDRGGHFDTFQPILTPDFWVPQHFFLGSFRALLRRPV